MELTIHSERLAICRLGPGAAWPAWADGDSFVSVTRTATELSVICPEAEVPEGVAMEPGWRRLEVQGPLPFSAVGVLADLAAVLSQAQIPIFTISTYETDHLLMKEDHLERALRALGSAGHRIAPEGQPSEGSP